MIIQAILVGIMLGFLEWILLISSKQKLGFWLFAQGILFWFTCGFMIGIVDSPLSPYITGAMIAVFLNLPWYINIAIIPKQFGHLIPLIAASTILGIFGGIVKMWLRILF